MSTIIEFRCERCSDVFVTKQNLLKHLHRKFICTPIDSEHDIDTQNLITKITQKPKTLFICSTCDKSFSTKHNLKRHMLKCYSNIFDFGNEKIDHITNQFLDKYLFSFNTGIENLIHEI